MFKRIFSFLFPFLIGIIFWHFTPYYLSDEFNMKISNLTSSFYRTLKLKDPTLPQFNPRDDLPVEECPDYLEAVNVYEDWLNNFRTKETDYKQFSPVLSENNPKNSLEGIVKWRFKKNQPYSGLLTSGEWEHFIENGDINKISTSMDLYNGLLGKLMNKGFSLHDPMHIPFYRYPGGLGAKKMGMIKNQTAYLFGVFEYDKNDFVERFEQMPKELNISYDLSHIQNPIVARVSCAKIEKNMEKQYEDYFLYLHQFTNETVVKREELENNLIRFTLLYPGGTNDYLANEFFYEKNGQLVFLQKTGEFPLCSIFENVKVGRDTSCYRSEKKEFDVVKY